MNIEPIATIYTPFNEKFTIPRQAAIVNIAEGYVQFTHKFQHSDCLNGLTEHSHYWLVWGFHAHIDKRKSLTVRPPRLGGNTRVGVFSTRSPFRPNNLGLSVVKLESVNSKDFSFTVSGVDMLDGTPIYDIKPYIPYADRRPEAESSWANDVPKPKFSVTFLALAEQNLNEYDRIYGRRLHDLVSTLLAYDARPAYKAIKMVDEKTYATQLYNVNIAWRVAGNIVTVISANIRLETH